MDYREKAIQCVKDTVLPVQRMQFEECRCDLDQQYLKYGNTEAFVAKIIEPGHVYEVGYPKCVCGEVLSAKKRMYHIVNVQETAFCISFKICFQRRIYKLKSFTLYLVERIIADLRLLFANFRFVV